MPQAGGVEKEKGYKKGSSAGFCCVVPESECLKGRLVVGFVSLCLSQTRAFLQKVVTS